MKSVKSVVLHPHSLARIIVLIRSNRYLSQKDREGKPLTSVISLTESSLERQRDGNIHEPLVHTASEATACAAFIRSWIDSSRLA